MLVFIDESGDPGFKLERGSTPIFAAAMVTFANSEDARATEYRVRNLLDKLHAHPEFKFNKSSDERRDAFFNGVADCPLRVRAIVVEKAIDLVELAQGERGSDLRVLRETDVEA